MTSGRALHDFVAHQNGVANSANNRARCANGRKCCGCGSRDVENDASTSNRRGARCYGDLVAVLLKFDFAAETPVNHARVADDERHADAGDDRHDNERFVRRSGVVNGEAILDGRF